jgi:hypothetical protein
MVILFNVLGWLLVLAVWLVIFFIGHLVAGPIGGILAMIFFSLFCMNSRQRAEAERRDRW